MSKKPAPHRWAIYLTHKRGEIPMLGTVEATDERSAIEAAIQRYGITDPERQRRLVAYESRKSGAGGGGMPTVDEQKFAEQVFGASLAILAVLIAVVGIIASEYGKPEVYGNPDVEPAYRWSLYAAAGLAGWGCLTSLLALARLRGREVWPWLILVSACVLIVGAAAGTIGIVVVTIFF